MVSKMTAILTEHMITLVTTATLTGAIGIFVLGFRTKTKKYIRDTFSKETETLNTRLASIDEKLDKMYKGSKETDLAILWGLLNDKTTAVLKEGVCDLDTLYYVENIYEKYKQLGGNHGMELNIKKVRGLCKKTEPREREIK